MRALITLILLITAGCAGPAARATSPRPPISAKDDAAANAWIDRYDQRYGLRDPLQKLTDNHGEGDARLYGTRNFREVLTGVLYRGGANNSFHHSQPRPNMNPLPEDGLQNLCTEGFGLAIYLYPENFNTASAQKTCASIRSEHARLEYRQLDGLSASALPSIHRLIFETIQDYRHGPIYAHCWNGWHASGFVSATALRQFCGWGAEEAVRYWDAATDGNNTDAAYRRVRQRIRDFRPDPALAITPEQRAAICPAK